MKKVIILCSLLMLLGCKSKKANTKPAETKKVTSPEMVKDEETQEQKAYGLGKRILMTCNDKPFKTFTASEATDKVIANSTPENISKICVKYNLKYGLFKDLQFVEMIKDKTENTHVYRFKALFEYADANKELRVTMDSDNKASAISTKDWKDEYDK